jgi:two-component system, NtrC family, nitrogen regulation response regulator NtrX
VKSKTNALKKSKILIVDDHRNIRVSLRMILESEGALVHEASTIASAITSLELSESSQDTPFDLILLDIRLPDGNGLDFLAQLSKTQKPNRVIVISGEGTATEAFRATEIGAFDFIEKPFTPERVLVSTTRCIEFHRIEAANENLNHIAAGPTIVGKHNRIKDVMIMIEKAAPTNGRVLIGGESGTGKELIAREIHRRSSRKNKPMIKVNCAAIPKNLMESELFGHEKGAFTGALKTRLGVFERADGGTLFLDEIGELELDLQAKLLRVLQNGEFSRVGGEKTIKTDVRIICATNRDLKQMSQTGDFREDLYYRLNVININSPALRERASDIPELSKLFLNECCIEHALGPKKLSENALRQLQEHTWPGNVRELRNVIERAAILSDDSVIDQIEDLAPCQTPEDMPPRSIISSIKNDENTDLLRLTIPVQSWEKFQESTGREFLSFLLEKTKGNVSEAARLLDLERAYLHRLIKKLDISRP